MYSENKASNRRTRVNRAAKGKESECEAGEEQRRLEASRLVKYGEGRVGSNSDKQRRPVRLGSIANKRRGATREDPGTEEGR